MQIRPLKEVTEEAFKELKKLQTGQKKLVKVGFDSVDSHIGGLLNGDILLFSGLSGHGKSETLFELKDNVLNTAINPDAMDYVFLDISLEMKVFNIILRGLHRRMTKSKKDILFTEFSDEEKSICKQYFESTQDDRQFISQSPSTPDELYKHLKVFLAEHTNKKAIFVAIDHILLLNGADKKGVIDNTMEYLNQLKLEFDNVYFIVISQLNRSVLARVAEKNNMASPTSADLYGSEFMQQAASYSVIVFNPFKVGIQQFMKVNSEFYDYLSEHFGDEDSRSGKISFNTIGKLFHIVTKVREGEAVFKDIFIKNMRMEADTRLKLENRALSPTSTPAFPTIPIFNQTTTDSTLPEIKYEDLKGLWDEIPTPNDGEPF